ncbi:COX15/CtaA family protein [Thaumasiovibrio sp. DFM-14]|uniref:COX15/CtaA family protein n=1 Tax=Thaumasiovibrio sp. DFM-14 TaxID=3384792 RepID=UPI0039A157C9
MKIYPRLLLLSLLLGVVVVGMGAYTRLTEAGLGCPDWPGCYGSLTVPSTDAQVSKATRLYPDMPLEVDKAWNEMIHRYLAASLGVMILVVFIAAWRLKLPLTGPASLLLLVIFQAMLGMWTVTMNLNPLIVMGHLLGGFALVSLLWWQWLCYRKAWYGAMPNLGRHLKYLGVIATACVVGQIALGGWTSANYAAVVCTSLPFCQVDWIDMYDATAFYLLQPEHETYQFGVLDYAQRVTIHVTHRLGAIVTTIVVLSYLIRLARSGVAKQYWSIPALMLCLQILLGINNVVSMLPLANAVAHNVVGLGLLLSMLYSVQAVTLAQRAFHSHGGQYGKI